MKQQPPIGDARLNRYARRAAHAQTNAVLIAKLALEDNAPRFTRPTCPVDPADTRTLRGIPAIGRGVAGASPGTSPHAIIERLDH